MLEHFDFPLWIYDWLGVLICLAIQCVLTVCALHTTKDKSRPCFMSINPIIFRKHKHFFHSVLDRVVAEKILKCHHYWQKMLLQTICGGKPHDESFSSTRIYTYSIRIQGCVANQCCTLSNKVLYLKSMDIIGTLTYNLVQQYDPTKKIKQLCNWMKFQIPQEKKQMTSIHQLLKKLENNNKAQS